MTDDERQQHRYSNVPGLVMAFSAAVTTGGSIYAFGIYGNALKKSLGLTQLQLNSISATLFIAGLFTWLPGMVVDRMGNRFAMILGGTTGALTTLLFWAVSRQFFNISHVVATLAILSVGMCLSCGLIIGSTFKLTLICGGPKFKGAAVGVAKGYVGLGAGVYATIFQALRTAEQSALDFIPVISVFFVICAIIPGWLLLPPQERMKPELVQIETTNLHFRIMYVSLFLVACTILGASVDDIIREESGDFETGLSNKHERDYRRVFLLLLIWLGPIWSLLFAPRDKSGEEKIPLIATTNAEDDLVATNKNDGNTFSQDQQEQTSGLLTSHKKSFPAVQDAPPDAKKEQPKDLNLTEMLQTSSAWLMLWTTTILVGSGTAKTNNMGEMVESLGFPDAVNPATITIFAVAQAAARIVTGVTSEAALNWKLPLLGFHYGIPRPFFLVIASTIAFVSHIMLAFATSQTYFVISCTISGFAFGMAWPLMVLIVGDVFGTKHAGANYMMYDGFTKAFGTIFLYISGNVYVEHVDQDVDPLICYGPSCFRETHLSIAGLALTGILASCGLIYTTRHAYSKKFAIGNAY